MLEWFEEGRAMIEKSDFKVGGRFEGDRRRNDPYGIHFNSGPATYRYRVPIGKDEDGNLIYSDYDREVQDTDWIFPAEIYRRANARDIVSREEYNNMITDPDFSAEEYGQRMRDAKVLAAIQQIMDTASHEAGHTAHKLADPEEQNWRWNEKMANRERGGYGLFNTRSDSDASSVGEFVAYMSEYPHDSVKFLQGMDNHPDVGERYFNRMGNAILDVADNTSRTKRNLINAILDQTATTGRRTGAGNFQFGDLAEARNRKKQAERTSRALIRQIQQLPNVGIEGFADLPQEIQEGIGRLQLREALSQFMENMYGSHRQAELEMNNYDPNSLDFAIANPEMLLENYDAVPVDWEERGYWGNYHLANDALSVIPHFDHAGRYDENPGLLEALQEKFGEPTYNMGWGLKPKVKSNPYMRTPMQYLDPRFGSESVLEDIMDEYAAAERRGVDLDSSRAFMKSWEMMR